MTNGSCRTVKLVLCMQNEKGFQRVDNLVVLCHWTIWTKGHAHEVVDVTEVNIGFNNIFTLENTHAGGSDCGHLTEDSMDVDITFFLFLVAEVSAIISLVRLMMAGR